MHRRDRSRSPPRSQSSLYGNYRHTNKDGRDVENSMGSEVPRRNRGYSTNHRERSRIPNIWSRSPSPPPRSPSPKRTTIPQPVVIVSNPAPKAAALPVSAGMAEPSLAGEVASRLPVAAAAAPPAAQTVSIMGNQVEHHTAGNPPLDSDRGSGSDSDSDSSDGSVAGPQLPPGMATDGVHGLGQLSTGKYGGGLRAGEGEAIAQFVQAGKRVPRRGEVGWSGEEIGGLEDLGYVMSGNRNKRMNAVRLRKENQVYSEEEKRALAQFNYDEQVAREGRMMGHFKEMLTAKGLMSDQADEAKQED